MDKLPSQWRHRSPESKHRAVLCDSNHCPAEMEAEKEAFEFKDMSLFLVFFRGSWKQRHARPPHAGCVLLSLPGGKAPFAETPAVQGATQALVMSIICNGDGREQSEPPSQRAPINPGLFIPARPLGAAGRVQCCLPTSGT